VGIAGEAASFGDNQRAVAETARAFGRLDIFVGNAGIFDVYASFAELDPEKLGQAYDELFAVNVKGCLYGAKAALPELKKVQGCMVFTASVAGLNSGGGGAIYTASKHAVVGLIRELAVELAPDIRVNGVAPGRPRHHRDDPDGRCRIDAAHAAAALSTEAPHADRYERAGRFRQRACQPAHLYRAGDLSGGAGAHLRALLALSVP